jgi:uracil-DNA glycosylase
LHCKQGAAVYNRRTKNNGGFKPPLLEGTPANFRFVPILPLRAKFQIVPDIMNQFPSALDLVMSALEQIRDRGEKLPRASQTSLVELQSVRPVQSGTERPPARQSFGGDASPSIQRTVDKAALLASIQARVALCLKCPHLARTRTQTVFGVGNPHAELMFIGEAPGADEDARGEPFVGRAGQLLTKIIGAMGFRRDEVYIANVLKCRPDMPPGSYGNRPPTPLEMQTCLPYLTEQIDIIQPKVLIALGATAVEGLLGTRGVMRELRGKWHSHQDTPLMITYHPSYLLRNQAPSEKRKVWEDMLQVLERLDRPITEKQRNYFS